MPSAYLSALNSVISLYLKLLTPFEIIIYFLDDPFLDTSQKRKKMYYLNIHHNSKGIIEYLKRKKCKNYF